MASSNDNHDPKGLPSLMKFSQQPKQYGDKKSVTIQDVNDAELLMRLVQPIDDDADEYQQSLKMRSFLRYHPKMMTKVTQSKIPHANW
jgi:hypothetical protein